MLRQESGPYLNRSMAHHKMAIRCLSFLQFSCFGAGLGDRDIANHIKRGDYLLLEYAETYWLQHVKAACSLDQAHLMQLDESLTRFFAHWRRDQEKPARTDCHSFGFAAFKDSSPLTYATLIQAAMYKSQWNGLGGGEGNSQREFFGLIGC